MLLGWVGLAIAVSGPIYSTTTSMVDANGVVTTSGPQLGLLQTGMSASTAVLLVATAVMFGLVTIAALLHVRTDGADAWRVLVAVTALLVVLVVLGLPTLGFWLVPGGAFALTAVQAGRRVQPLAHRQLAQVRPVPFLEHSPGPGRAALSQVRPCGRGTGGCTVRDRLVVVPPHGVRGVLPKPGDRRGRVRAVVHRVTEEDRGVHGLPDPLERGEVRVEVTHDQEAHPLS